MSVGKCMVIMIKFLHLDVLIFHEVSQLLVSREGYPIAHDAKLRCSSYRVLRTECYNMYLLYFPLIQKKASPIAPTVMSKTSGLSMGSYTV